MKNLEERIQTSTDEDFYYVGSCLNWKWYGYPQFTSLYKKDNEYSYGPHIVKKHVEDVHKMIESANEAECLLSPIEYVREYKKWLENESRSR